MFCYQCEQTMKGTGCTSRGVCGKDHETATLQDLLLYVTKGIAQYAHRLGEMGVSDPKINLFVTEALFTTITNVNFDPQKLDNLVMRAVDVKKQAENLYNLTCVSTGAAPEKLAGPALYKPADTPEARIAQGVQIGIERQREKHGDTAAGLQNLILFGLKGMAAYLDHAHILGFDDDSLYAFVFKALNILADEVTDTGRLLETALALGEANLRTMELLDRANTSVYGNPEPTTIRTTPIKGKCILVSGHDLHDLHALLKQTEGKGINIYTHGEMLPALAYPGLKKFKHLAGNFGSSWQKQIKEFPEFPGAILMTTNCIQKPQESYRDRIFTTGLVQWPGVPHVHRDDFSKVIEAALSAEGFLKDEPEETITIGFGRNTLMGVLDDVIGAVKDGKLRRIFLVGGCDGAKPGRNYYTEIAKKIPQDCLILTLACGKYRFNKMDFGTVAGFPRLLDAGQCNDAYTAITVAAEIASRLGAGLNDLPLTLVLSWYEQKAVVILLTLLYLGIKNMRLGPSLPAFVTPEVLAVLKEKFNIMPITTPEEDLEAILG